MDSGENCDPFYISCGCLLNMHRRHSLFRRYAGVNHRLTCGPVDTLLFLSFSDLVSGVAFLHIRFDMQSLFFHRCFRGSALLLLLQTYSLETWGSSLLPRFTLDTTRVRKETMKRLKLFVPLFHGRCCRPFYLFLPYIYFLNVSVDE